VVIDESLSVVVVSMVVAIELLEGASLVNVLLGGSVVKVAVLSFSCVVDIELIAFEEDDSFVLVVVVVVMVLIVVVVVGGKERVVVMEFTSVVFSTDIGPLSVLSTLCLVL
jgi:hypothetical protein